MKMVDFGPVFRNMDEMNDKSDEMNMFLPEKWQFVRDFDEIYENMAKND